MSLAGFSDVVLPFILLLGVLIFIHELGHFLVAKYFNVKCERFSLGFGPSLLARTVGETEYVIGVLPLGGYVKMLGEIPGEELAEEERDRAFNLKPVHQRMAISVAGPAMNIVLPIVLIAGMLMAGVPTLTSLVGAVAPDSAAERAGLQGGDRIVAIDGEAIWRWSDLITHLRETASPTVLLEIERDSQRTNVSVTRETLDDGRFGPIGAEPSPPSAVFAVSGPQSAAARAGMLTGDVIRSVDGTAVANRYDVERLFQTASGELELEVERTRGDARETLIVTIPDAGSRTSESLGLQPVDFAVNFVDPASPASEAGIEPGDIFLRANSKPIQSWNQLVVAIRGSEGDPIEMTLLRAGLEVDLKVSPIRRAVQVGEEMETHFAIGIGGGTPRNGGEMLDDVVSNPFVALWRAVQRTVEIFNMILGGVFQLFTGKVGLNNLAGPIGIGEIAADSFQTSWLQFLSFMAVISVNLAILNLLPIPILDGGQILLAAAEGIKGSPLPNRAREIAQTVGLSLILALMGLAFWNDLARKWAGIVDFLKGLV
ncbi:MAG: RIP metalloprotease RseP [bacterium]|nr:RIP metalloprotease RseP [bacterium]